MKTKKERLVEIQNELIREMNKIHNRYQATGTLTSAEEEEYHSLYDESRKYDEDLEREEVKFQRRIKQARARISQDPTLWPLDSAKRKSIDSIALRSYLLTGEVPEQLRGLMVRAAQQSTTDGSGGYTVPETIGLDVEIALKSLGGMWERCRVVKTQRGNPMPWPLINDADEEAVLITEGNSMSTGAAAVPFGVENFSGYKFTSRIIEVPAELLQDSDLFIPAFVEAISRRIFKGTNRYFTNGTGSGQPHGITSAAVYGGSSADDAAIAYDDLVKLLHSVDPEYRNSPGAAWMFHDTTLKALRTLKEATTNKPLLPELNEGKLLGLPFSINNHLEQFVPATGNDGKKLIFFGDWSKYVIRQVKDITIRRTQQTNADKDMVAFAAILRVDGDLLDAGTHPVKYLKMSTT